MSSLQNKLYNYEQTPPGNAWDKIAAALDESHIADKFPSKLYNTELAPPAIVWDNIAETLDKSHITDKFSSKLYNAEVAPPAGVWNKIASSLETDEPRVVNMRRKSFSFFRYAAAAVFIGLVTFGVIKWLGRNNDKSAGEIAAKTDSTLNDNKADLPNEKNTAEVKNEQPAVTPEENIATTNIEDTKISAKKVKSKYSIPDNDNIDTEPIYAYEHTPNLADRYIMLMTPDGGFVRMSKKWGNLVCCVSGQEQDKDCKDQLKKWQEKIACSPVTTSPGNFMDILSLVSALNETEL